jgi:non-ribosomal peptide synthetase component F/thioesterase domain-containing protein/acyl carrier protein
VTSAQQAGLSPDSGGKANAESEGLFVLPMSLGQERLWALDRAEAGNPAWNLAVRFRLAGTLEVAVLERALTEIVRRHEVLRTSYEVVDGQPAQIISPSLKVEVPQTDLSSLAEPERDAEVERLCLVEARRCFDLSRGPLFRAGIIRIANDEHILMLTCHLSVADYWSIGLIAGELGSLYESYSRGLESSLPELTIQYGDYAIWQRQQSDSALVLKQLDYWKDQLRDLPALDFPVDHPRLHSPTNNSRIKSVLLPVEMTDAIREFSNQQGATFFNTALAALAIVLYRCTGQLDFGVGAQFAGRPGEEVERLVGMFINTAILRMDLNGDPSFSEFLGRVKESGAQAIANQDLRFEQLLKELRPQHYPSHHTLFRVNFVCQRDEIKPLAFSGIQLTGIPSISQGALYDLNFFLIFRTEGWRLSCEYNTDLFDESTITELLGNYRLILENVAEKPLQKISQLAVMARTSKSPLIDSHRTIARDVSDHVTPDASQSPSGSRTSTAQSTGAPSANPAQGETYAFPITIVQERFWMLEQLTRGTPTLNMQIAMRLNGPLDCQTLERSLNEVITRHEMLRTSFTSLDGHAVQVIHPSLMLTVNFVDLENLPESARESNAQRAIREEALEPFDISRLPLVRATLLRLSADHHILMITMPHIICDGWSNGVLINELTTLYDAFSRDERSPLAEPDLQYADFAHWQNQWLRSERFEDDRSYWKKQLRGRLPLLDLPIDASPKSTIVSPCETQTITFDPVVVDALKDFCKREEVTMFMFFLAIFKTMLHRYTGQEDILVGSPIAGRISETEGVIGPFSYPISLRTSLAGNLTFRELLGRVRDVVVGALEHKDLPFGLLVDELNVQQVQGRNPLFQVYFLHQVAFVKAVRTHHLSWTPFTWVSRATTFDLHLATVERPEGVVARLEYNAEKFTAPTIERMLGHMRRILDAIMSNPDARISELPLLTSAEALLISQAGECAPAANCNSQSLESLIEDQVRKIPDAIAAVSADEKLSYRDLDARAGRLARVLSEVDLGTEGLVGICCDRSTTMLIGVLAALKAGARYWWLQPDSMDEPAIRDICRDRLKVMVAQVRDEKRYRELGLHVICVDKIVSAGADEQISAPCSNSSVESVACVQVARVAGQLKPVAITNQALLARVQSAAQVSGVALGDRIAWQGEAIAEEQILSALLCGATTVFVPAPAVTSYATFLRFLGKQKCTAVGFSSRFWEQLVVWCSQEEAGFPPAIRSIVVHGDQPAPSVLREFRKITRGSVRWVSTYGGVETGPLAAVCEVGPGSADVDTTPSLCLGAPAPGVQIRLVDKALQTVPVGMHGEISVAGATLAKGYVNDAKLSEERFVSDPLSGRPTFRTGELGRYLPDGRIEFLGPTDRHLNLQGYRIHLAELEAALLRHPAVEDAVALPSEVQTGDQQAVAYVSIGRGVADAKSQQRKFSLLRELQSRLTEQCHAYPPVKQIVLVERLKRFADGRTDLSAVPAAKAEDSILDSSVVAARNPLESQLVEIWEELLGVSPIGITDNFFELHGHSLLALRLFARLNAQFGRSLPLSTLFHAPTIEKLAELLQQDSCPQPASSLVAIRAEGTRPPLFIISGLGGNVVRFYELARHLPKDRPVYALQPPGLDGTRAYLTRVQDMAEYYINEIKARQVHGPYELAGYSFGGLVAFEMACQLADRGDDANFVALLDSPEWHYEMEYFKAMTFREKMDRLRSRLIRIVFEPKRSEYVRNAVRRRVSNLIFAAYRVFGRPVPQRAGTIEDINRFAAANYVPRTYPGKLNLFRTRRISSRIDDYCLGWGPLAQGGVEVHEVPGDHDTMTDSPNAYVLAQKLAACLRAAPPRWDHFGIERVQHA